MEYRLRYALVLAGALLVAGLNGCARSPQQKSARRLLEAVEDRGAQACVAGVKSAPFDAQWMSEMVDGLFGLPETEANARAWATCIATKLEALTPSQHRAARRALLQGFITAMDSSRRREDVAALNALNRVLLQTRHFVDLRPEVTAARTLVEEHTSGVESKSVAECYRRWLSLLGLMQGRLEGALVTEARIGEMDDQQSLLRLARFIPEAAIRQHAKRRVIALRVDGNAYPEFRDLKTQIVDSVIRNGRFVPPLKTYRPIALRTDSGVLPTAGALHPSPQLDRYRISPIFSADAWRDSPVALFGIKVELENIEQPIGLCRHRGELDPTPCVPIADLVPTVGMWGEGGYYLSKPLNVKETVRLAKKGTVEIGFSVAGQSLTLASIPLDVTSPPPMRFTGQSGKKGPDLRIRIERASAEHYLFRVDSDGAQHFALVREPDARGYPIVSRGGDGADGEDGRDGRAGRDGRDGADAVCPNTEGEPGGDGGDGYRGADGGPGDRGGDGGRIQVTLDCRAIPCPNLTELIGIVSEGGKGGTGGRGGDGGSGGDGGKAGRSVQCKTNEDGTFETTRLAANSLRDGEDGRQGRDGRAGLSGEPGRPGAVVGLPRLSDGRVVPVVQSASIFVMRMQNVGVDSDTAQLYEEALLADLQRREHFSVIGASDVNAMLDVELQRDLLGCSDVSCMAEIAGALDADLLLRGVLGRVGDEVAVNLSLVSSSEGVAVARVQQNYATAGELMRGIPRVLVNLLGR